MLWVQGGGGLLFGLWVSEQEALFTEPEEFMVRVEGLEYLFLFLPAHSFAVWLCSSVILQVWSLDEQCQYLEIHCGQSQLLSGWSYGSLLVQWEGTLYSASNGLLISFIYYFLFICCIWQCSVLNSGSMPRATPDGAQGRDQMWCQGLNWGWPCSQ